MKRTLSVLVQNQPGVLAHVAGMFAARSFNIDSLAVGRTEDPGLSRMTIVVLGDDAILEQVRKQLGKIVPVMKIFDYTGDNLVLRDLMLLKVSAPPEKRAEIQAMIEMFHGKVVDVDSRFVMVEIAGPEEKIEAFIDMCRPYGIKDVVRTGMIAMPRHHRSK
ncbi:MAG: acetolactate synthase small subunit [Phycisphaerae bacterium]|nr:acetolactate synthase small subunit [Phycisphaerae bacterium]